MRAKRKRKGRRKVIRWFDLDFSGRSFFTFRPPVGSGWEGEGETEEKKQSGVFERTSYIFASSPPSSFLRKMHLIRSKKSYFMHPFSYDTLLDRKSVV